MNKKLVTIVASALMVLFAITGCSSKYSTVTDYVNDPKIKAVFDASIEAQSADMEGIAELTLESEDDNLIYLYTFVEGTDVTGMGEIMGEYISSQEETFVNAANEIKTVVKQDTITVTVKFVENDGTEIYVQEFTSDK